MLTQRSADGNHRLDMMGALAMSDNLSGGLGIAWPLVIQVAGWIIQGIGLGFSVHEAITSAKDQIPAGEKLTKEEVGVVAEELAQKFPTTSKSSWEQLLLEGMADKVQAPTATPAIQCPTGYVRDPVSGACMPVQTASAFNMPTWGWVALGFGAFLFVMKSGILKG